MSVKESKNVEAQNLGKEPVAEGSALTDPATAEVFRRIRALNGTATRVVVKRRSLQGKYLFVRGASVTFDPPKFNLLIDERRKAHVPKRKPGSGNQVR